MNKKQSFIKQLGVIVGLFTLIFPAISGATVYNTGGLDESGPVKTSGVITSSTYVSNSNTKEYDPFGNVFNFHLKTQAEKDAEKKAKDDAAAKAADDARVAKNADGSFSYGYIGGVSSDVAYKDARSNRNSLLGSAGSAGSKGFLPTTFWGWALTILLSTFVVILIMSLMEKLGKQKNTNSHLASAH